MNRNVDASAMAPSRALKYKEKIGLKLGLGKCGKTKVFQVNFYGVFFFQIALKIKLRNLL